MTMGTVISYQLSVISYQLSVISYQLSVISYQLSVISYQLSVISYQLSVISYQLSVISYQLVVQTGEEMNQASGGHRKGISLQGRRVFCITRRFAQRSSATLRLCVIAPPQPSTRSVAVRIGK
jgi:hypothetical protein